MLQASEWHPQGGGHRGPDGLSIQRIACPRAQEDCVNVECRGIAKYRADVIGVGDRLEQHEQTGVLNQSTNVNRSRTMTERQTSPMEMETGNRIEHVRRTFVHGHRRRQSFERAGKCGDCGLGNQHRFNRMTTVVDQPLHDMPSFGDEQSVGTCQLWVPDARIERDPRIVGVFDRRGARQNVCHRPTLPLPPVSRRLAAALIAAVLVLIVPARLDAHPSPFSYLDVHATGEGLKLTLVVHIFDVAHDLPFDPPERLLDADVLADQGPAIARLLASRMHISTDGNLQPAPAWRNFKALPERQSIQMAADLPLSAMPGLIAIDTAMFPYDIAHQTFVNVYEEDTLRLQAILDASKTRLDYYAGTRQGIIAVVRQFVRSGATHILASPDHLVFLVGLLLLGGTLSRFAIIATAFTAAHALVLPLVAFSAMDPPARMVEPAIALSIIYIGVDNLLVRGGRDVRVWIAAAFGVLHALGLGGPMRSLDLPRPALGWSLLSFNVGVEIAQLIAVGILGSLLIAVHRRYPASAPRLASAASIIVVAIGVFWFIERVFFPGGLSDGRLTA